MPGASGSHFLETATLHQHSPAGVWGRQVMDLVGREAEGGGAFLLVQKSGEKTTVWMVLKPCEYWDKLPTSTGDRRIFVASTVATCFYRDEKPIRIGETTLFLTS